MKLLQKKLRDEKVCRKLTVTGIGFSWIIRVSIMSCTSSIVSPYTFQFSSLKTFVQIIWLNFATWSLILLFKCHKKWYRYLRGRQQVFRWIFTSARGRTRAGPPRKVRSRFNVSDARVSHNCASAGPTTAPNCAVVKG